MRRSLVTWAVALAPFVLLCGLVAVWHNRIPLFDEWAMADLLRQHSRGELGVGDFWAQTFSDHRIVLPRMIIYALARMTNWTVGYEVVVSLLLALATFALLAHLVRVTLAAPSRQAVAIAGVSAVVLSPVAWENWVWGWQIAWLLTNAGFVLAVAALCGLPRLELRVRFSIAAMGAVISSLSLAHGLLVWIACLPVLLIRSEWRRWRLPWVGLTIATFAVYARGYADIHDVSSGRVVDGLGAFVAYAVTYLVRPLSFDGDLRVVAAVATAASVGVVAWAHRRASPPTVEAVLPWLVLTGFALLAALVTAAGRSELGLTQATASRYTTVSGLFVAAILVLLVRSYDAAGKHGRVLSVTAGAAVIFLVGLGYLHGVKEMERHHGDLMLPTQRCARSAQSATDPCVATTELTEVWPLVEFLRAHDLAGL